ncbi:MAG: regulatory protein RecX [Desulfobacterales bacterium]|nr:regulatory protein RecX [Desulfobacterales bacterium]
MTTQDPDPTFKSAMETAVRILTRRNHSCHELRTKLIRKGISREVATEVQAACEQLNYLDDRRMARFYVDELQAKGYGFYFVQKAMRTKGFAQELIDLILGQARPESDEIETARRALEKKQRTFEREKDPGKRREKIYRYLYSRGFSSSVIATLTRR